MYSYRYVYVETVGKFNVFEIFCKHMSHVDKVLFVCCYNRDSTMLTWFDLRLGYIFINDYISVAILESNEQTNHWYYISLFPHGMVMTDYHTHVLHLCQGLIMTSHFKRNFNDVRLLQCTITVIKNVIIFNRSIIKLIFIQITKTFTFTLNFS